MAYNVKFLKGTAAAFGSATKDLNTFYYVDEKDLYLGNIKLSNAEEIAAAIVRIGAIEADYLKTADKTALQNAIDDINEELGALTGSESGQSISQMIKTAVDELDNDLQPQITANANAIKAVADDYLKGADKTELEGKIKANTDAITLLNGDDQTEGSVAKEVKDAINAFATAVTENGTYDTFAELVNYVETHGGEAAEMASAIDALETKVGEKTVALQISEAIAAENLDQYATDTELGALTEVVNGKAAQSEVNTISGKVSTLEGKVDVEKVSTAIATAKSEATKHADDAIAALDADVKSAEVEAGKGLQVQVVEVDGKITTVAISGNYDNKYDVKGAAATAETNAKAHADTVAGTAETNAKAYAKEYADGLAGNYATAEQGTKAESALQAADITIGGANGTIAVKGTDVAVKGLGSAAYAATTAFDAAGSASTAEANAKAYVDTALTWGTIA